MELNERLKQLKKVLDIPINRFVEISGVSPQMVHNYLSGKNVVPVALIQQILFDYPQLSAEWLLRGEGDMLRTPSGAATMINSNNINGNSGNVSVAYGGQIDGKGKNLPVISRVPVITPELSCRPDYDIVQNYRTGKLSMRMVEAISRCGEYTCSYVVNSDSMAPDYHVGDYLAIHLQEGKDVIPGNTYVLDTKLGVILRCAYDSGKTITCRSLNPERFPDIIIRKTDIYSVFTILGQLRLLC